jgi:glycosyltransferase involved in cell wall biosynthesis
MTRPYVLSIVIPVYNGARSIGPLVDALAGLAFPGKIEVILVNDGSPDDSAEVCRKLVDRKDIAVTFVDLARNFGEHNAVMAGLAKVRGDFVITMDDDLQNPPEEVVRLFEHARSGRHDVVYTYYERKQHENWRNLGSRLTNWLASSLIGKPKDLYLSSFRCMNAFLVGEIVRHTGPYPYVDGLIFQITRNVGRLQVRHLPRFEGQSNYTLRRLIRLFLSMFLNFSVMPLRASTLLGLATGFAGLVALAIVLVEVVFGATPEGWASLMVVVLLISGVQLTLLGIIGEYLGRMFLTANHKPQYVVREVVRGPNVTSGN